MNDSDEIRPWLRAAIHSAVHRPGAVLSVWAVVSMVALVGVWNLDFDTSTESVLDRSDPAWQFYRDSVDRFGGDEIVVIAVEARRPYALDALAEVVRLSDHVEGLPGVRRVDSLSTFSLIRVTHDGELVLDPALTDGPPRCDRAARAIADQVARDRIALGNLVSADGMVFAVNVLVDANSAAEQAELMERINAAIDSRRTWVSGVPVFRTGVNARTRSDVLLFVPITVGAIAVLLVAFFGSAWAAATSLLASGAGTLVTLGAMGALGTPVTISTMILPSILLALGSAYAMHVLNAAAGVADREELERAVGSVANPIVLSALTTAIGFVALSMIRIDAIRDLGGYGALGVVSLLAAILTLAPALLRLRPLGKGGGRLEAFLRRDVRRVLLGFAGRRRMNVIGLWSLAVVIFGFGLPRLEVETDATIWFPHGSHVRDSYERIREHLSGISPVNVIVEATGSGRVTAPDVVAKLDLLGRHLEAMDEVGKVVTLADPLAQIHSGFTGGPADALPEDQALIEQYLLLLESVEYLGDVVTPDRRSANVLLRVDNNGSEDLISVAREAETWWEEHGPRGFSARATGIMYEFARSENEIAWGQVRGLGFALIAIGGVLFAIFRWPAVAAMAVVPNVVPLVIVFGWMGLAGVALDAVTVGLGCMALGIAVDDTIHLVSNYRRAALAGRLPLDAVGEALGRILPPLVYTSIAIAVGFGILGLSNFTVTRNLGLVTSGFVVLCLLADLVLLPALLVAVGPTGIRVGGGGARSGQR